MSKMVKIEVGDEQEQRLCTGKHPHNYRVRPGSDYSYAPWEIWFEILSRLPIKYLLVCRSVCKFWRAITSHVCNSQGNLPLCGLLIRNGLKIGREIHSEYICLSTNETKPYSLDNKSLISSGYESGLLAGLWFNFDTIPRRKPLTFVTHKGLLLLCFSDGTYEVHNPVTKQVFAVPMSALVEMHGTSSVALNESCGILINLSGLYSGSRCRFRVVRFSHAFEKIEIYYSETKRWSSKTMKLEKPMTLNSKWDLENYVALYETQTQTISLYFLIGERHGLASILNNNPENMLSFPLPRCKLRGRLRKILWDCQSSLLLCYCLLAGFEIWKAGSTRLDAWEWIPYLEVSNNSPENLAKIFKADENVKTVACHPSRPIIYLLINPCIFEYDLDNDTVVKIAEIDEFHRFNKGNVIAFPFTPCLSSFDDADIPEICSTDEL